MWWVRWNGYGILWLIFGIVVALYGLGLIGKVRAEVELLGSPKRGVRGKSKLIGPALICYGLLLILTKGPPAPKWHEIAEPGRFSIQMPEGTVYIEKLDQSEAGPVTMHIWTRNITDGLAYVFRYADMPVVAGHEAGKVKPQELIDHLGKNGFTILSFDEFDVNGNRSLRGSGTARDGTPVDVQYTWWGNREFVLMRIARPALVPRNDQFFTSFTVPP